MRPSSHKEDPLSRHRSWGLSSSGMRRSQSGESVNSRQTSSTSTLRASPPDEIPTIVEDVPVLMPPPSPGTPPKKLWERQYRNFLTRNKRVVMGGSSAGNEELPLAPPNLEETKKPHHKRTGSTSHAAGKEKSNEGSSVRGGNLFSNMFRNEHHHHHHLTTTPPLPSRRVRSCENTDELDGTLRRGAEKAYSPGNQRYQQQQQQQQPFNSQQQQQIPSDVMSQQDRVFLRPQHDPYAVHSKFMAPVEQLQDGLLLSSSSSSAMKKAFTEFHNLAGHDSAAPYLGDDTSFSGQQGLFWPQQKNHQQATTTTTTTSSTADDIKSTPISGSVSHGSLPRHHQQRLSPFLDTVQENVAIQERRILKPIQGVDVWQSGRRYLIAPAALAACPLAVLKILSGSLPPKSATEAVNSTSSSPFGTIVLGECLLTYAMGQKHATAQRWSSAVLVLQQNYLLEYRCAESQQEMPRGYANLELGVCHVQPDFNDGLELHFYASPCAKADKRVLMIRLKDKSQRGAWRTLLNRAANLDIKDLYEYDETKAIGQGLYASVYAAKRKGSRQDCALKIFDKNHFWRLVVKGRERSDTLVREASVQATLTAKCGKVASFVRIHGFFETSDKVVLEFELLDGADLFKYVSSKSVLSEPEAAHILRDILQALEAMNRIGLAHRDIKPANVLLCKNMGGEQLVKVCDFGMATFVDVDGHVRGRCGTPGYVAPEIFTAGVHGGYGNKVDVFSAGVTLYVMLCGYEPFYGETDAELVEANRQADIEFPADDWSSISRGARDLARKMLEPDPKKRLDAKTALKHPWFNQHKFEADVLDASLSLPMSEAPAESACVIS